MEVQEGEVVFGSKDTQGGKEMTGVRLVIKDVRKRKYEKELVLVGLLEAR